MGDRLIRFRFRGGGGLGMFLSDMSKPALGPSQPPIQWVPGTLSLGLKWPGCEADHLSPSSVEVKEYVELYLHSPNTSSWRGDQLSTGKILRFTLPYLTLYGCLATKTWTKIALGIIPSLYGRLPTTRRIGRKETRRQKGRYVIEDIFKNLKPLNFALFKFKTSLIDTCFR
jgi:hypothetical protein